MYYTYSASQIYCVCVCRLQIHQDLRDDLAKVKTLEGLANVSKQLKLRCQVTEVLMMHHLMLRSIRRRKSAQKKLLSMFIFLCIY